MIEIRRLTREDGHLLQQVVEKFKSEEVSVKRIDDFLKDDVDYVLASIDDNEVVGFLLAYELPRFDKNSMMYVHEVNVLPKYRRRGIGSRLIQEIIRICEERGLCKMFLITNKSNVPASRLYEATGARAVDDDSIIYCYDEF